MLPREGTETVIIYIFIIVNIVNNPCYLERGRKQNKENKNGGPEIC